MGLAERFKDKLDKKDIFKKNPIEKKLEDSDIKFISKSITSEITIKPKEIHSGVMEPVESLADIQKTQSSQGYYIPGKFDDLETEIIDKIRKTPYWEEYSAKKQEQMISSYFEIKTKKLNIEYSTNERSEFIRNITTLANNR